jgi:hypothetical protein
MNKADIAAMNALIEAADAEHDGHMTIYKFTTNWRVSFDTPAERSDVLSAYEGATLAEAVGKALVMK